MRKTAAANLWATALKVTRNKANAWTYAHTFDAEMRSRIAMFHNILPDGTPNEDIYACTLSELLGSIACHREKGFRYVSLDAMLNVPDDGARYGRVALTFDDGYASLLTLVAPALAELDIPFTAYITTDFLDHAPYLTREQLVALAAYPLCTIGAHSLSHPMTRFLSSRDAAREIGGCKPILEDILHREVRHFAFPYGSAYACSLRDIRIAQRAGYASAALTGEMFLPLSGALWRYRLQRMNMPET